MKALLALILTATFSMAIGAQRAVPADLTPMKARNLPGQSLAKAVADTIVPAFTSDTCFTNPGKGITAYLDDSERFEGFLVGSNTYGDVEQMQRLTYDGAETFYVTEVITGFYQYNAQTINDGYLVATVYDELDAAGNLNERLGTSDTLRLEDISFEDFVSFTFSDPVEVSNDSFFVGIDFSGLYEDIADTTGYVGITTSFVDCGDGNNVIQIFPVDDDFFFDTFRESYTTDLEIYIIAVVNDEISSTRQPLADYGATIFPNPAADLATLRLSAKSNGHYVATLTDLNGRQLRRSVPDWVGGQPQIEWQVSDLATGMYLYHVDGPEGRQSGKVMVR